MYVGLTSLGAYGWAFARFKERPTQLLVLVVAFFFAGPSYINQTYIATQYDPPATALLANAAIWLPVLLAVQVVAYRNTGIVAGAYDADDLPLRTALFRAPQLLVLGLAFSVATSIAIGLFFGVVGLVWSLLGPIITVLLALLSAILAIPRVVRAVSAAAMAFPAAIIDGGILEALGLGWEASAEAPYTTVGILVIGAGPIAAMQVLAGEPSALWGVLGATIGLWSTAATVALGRAYVIAHPLT